MARRRATCKCGEPLAERDGTMIVWLPRGAKVRTRRTEAEGDADTPPDYRTIEKGDGTGYVITFHEHVYTHRKAGDLAKPMPLVRPGYTVSVECPNCGSRKAVSG